MTSIIIVQHNDMFFRITYRNKNIVSITRHNSDLDPRGHEVQYDSLSLPERESILIGIINHLNSYV